ncbi:hypothetical protein Dsin_022210 [Dipteronia sinensis]|uniref:Uncharacterized protein n=1 Tax=Dipteronia sinensis TaxID=43782 RepID=A0AAE0A138_9ROSI|nr:hypothetical protein Dsin_022210 [Dipteronia sinensis]
MRMAPGAYEAGYNSEEYYRDSMDHTRFAINQVENKITDAKIKHIKKNFSIPESVGLRLPSDGELAYNPAGYSVAFHPAFLEMGTRLPLPTYIRRMLREVGVAPAQLNLNGWRILIGMFALWRSRGFLAPTFTEIGHCYSLFSHKSEGDGWWGLACCDKQEGEPLITGLPSSNKEWKQTWFVADGDWGKEFIRSVFNLPGKLTVRAKKMMADLGQDMESRRKKLQIPTGPSLLKKTASSDTEHMPKRSPVGGTSASAVTISEPGAFPPTGIPLVVSAEAPVRGPTLLVDMESYKDTLPELYMRDPRISLNYYVDPLARMYDPRESLITPDTGMQFMCSYWKDMLRSRETSYFGKMSNVDRIRQSQGTLWQIGHKEPLGDGKKIRGQTGEVRGAGGGQDCAVEELKEMLLRSYPDFNFTDFDREVQKAIESRERPKQDPVEDIFTAFAEEVCCTLGAYSGILTLGDKSCLHLGGLCCCTLGAYLGVLTLGDTSCLRLGGLCCCTLGAYLGVLTLGDTSCLRLGGLYCCCSLGAYLGVLTLGDTSCLRLGGLCCCTLGAYLWVLTLRDTSCLRLEGLYCCCTLGAYLGVLTLGDTSCLRLGGLCYCTLGAYLGVLTLRDTSCLRLGGLCCCTLGAYLGVLTLGDTSCLRLGGLCCCTLGAYLEVLTLGDTSCLRLGGLLLLHSWCLSRGLDPRRYIVPPLRRSLFLHSWCLSRGLDPRRYIVPPLRWSLSLHSWCLSRGLDPQRYIVRSLRRSLLLHCWCLSRGLDPRRYIVPPLMRSLLLHSWCLSRGLDPRRYIVPPPSAMFLLLVFQNSLTKKS